VVTTVDVVVAPWHASQQLPVPGVALPPFGALHLLSFLIEHFDFPRLLTRQQVTNPSLPHVDLAAQLVTAPLHSCGSAASFFAKSATQLT
jgi:hypothetical protein